MSKLSKLRRNSRFMRVSTHIYDYDIYVINESCHIHGKIKDCIGNMWIYAPLVYIVSTSVGIKKRCNIKPDTVYTRGQSLNGKF